MTDTDLARQIAAYVDATTEPVANPAARRNGQPIRPDPTETETIMLTEEHTEKTPTRRPIAWLALAAAAAAVIVIGFVVSAGGSDEEPAPVDQPTPSPPATRDDQPASTPPATPAESVIVDGEPGAQAPDLAVQAAIGDEFMEALAAHDADAATALASSDATINLHGGPMGDGLFQWYDATGFRFDAEDCRAFEGGDVTCQLTVANTWSDAVEVDPVRARVAMTIENGTITELTYVPSSAYNAQVFQPFFRYVLENHRNDADSMWLSDLTGEQPEFTGLILDDRSIELFERYSLEYEEAMAEGS